MEESTGTLKQLAKTSKHFAQQLLIIGENPLELLAVEVQEGRERLLHAILLALAHPDVDRRFSRLVAQQKLGLVSQRLAPSAFRLFAKIT